MHYKESRHQQLMVNVFQGKRYYKRFIRILAVYTDLELFASTRGAEYDRDIAERIALTYQTYLDVCVNCFQSNA